MCLAKLMAFAAVFLPHFANADAERNYAREFNGQIESLYHEVLINKSDYRQDVLVRSVYSSEFKRTCHFMVTLRAEQQYEIKQGQKFTLRYPTLGSLTEASRLYVNDVESQKTIGYVYCTHPKEEMCLKAGRDLVPTYTNCPIGGVEAVPSHYFQLEDLLSAIGARQAE